MSDRQARGVERAIQEAEARGEFKNLPGAGKPLPGIGQPLHEDWWLHQQATRESMGLDALPPALRLGKEREDLPATLDALGDEAAVRAAVEELNGRIRKALIGPVEGPPLRFGLIDVDEAVAAWKVRRQ
ncbi:J-domain-containing protein [Glycomyces sp. MUSA5-2]|uniref:DnaJ family domain-containing protein n=1 Tax=Glycomyces sp. MUSA5-2 TaxID=2053002 RepID=UPI003009CB22